MSRYLPFVARACCVGAIVVIVAIVSRQVYLLNAADAGSAGEDEAPAAKMLIRCETVHSRLHSRHSPADPAQADELPRARCRES